MRRGRQIVVWILIACAAGVLLAGAGLWGFYVHRNHVFPYWASQTLLKRIRPPTPRRFHFVKADATKSLAPEDIEKLARIPYLRGYRPASGGTSVLVHDPSRALDGLNLFVSGHAPVATLMDMDGRTIKTWTTDVMKAFPDLHVRGEERRESTRFMRDAHLLPDGDVVAMFQEIGIVRLGPASEVRWTWRGLVHHEIYVDPTGPIWGLTHRRRPLPDLHPDEPVWEDFVIELSADGNLMRSVSILDCLRHSAYAPLLTRLPHEEDVFHTNSIQVFDGSLADRSPLFRKGNLLISIRNLEFLAILDPDAQTVRWAWTGQWHRQHSGRLLANGHVMLFDNLGSLRAVSRVLEFDPFAPDLVWSYGALPGQEFFSETNGFVRRLPNGNTLVGETNAGRVLEVTADHQIVWEFANPYHAGKKNELVANIFDLERIPWDVASRLWPDAAAARGRQQGP